MKRTNLKSFKEKAFKRAEVKKAYDDLTLAYRFRRQLITLRHNADLTQE